MITLLRVQDPSDIKKLLTRDDLYKEILGLSSIDGWSISWDEALLLGIENGTELGIVFLKDMHDGYINFHAGLFKEQRHKNTLRILKKTLKKLKRSLYPAHIMTTVKETNIAAIKLDEAVGFKYKKTKTINGIKYRIYVE